MFRNRHKDEVNPDYPHVQEQALREILQPAGWELVARSPVYPQFDSWLSGELQTAVKRWRKTLTPVSLFPSRNNFFAHKPLN